MFRFQFLEIIQHEESDHEQEKDRVTYVCIIKYKVVETGVQDCRYDKASDEIVRDLLLDEAERPLVADYRGRQGVEERGADEAEGDGFEDAREEGAACGRRGDIRQRADVLERREAERGDDHVDHRVDRFVELGDLAAGEI